MNSSNSFIALLQNGGLLLALTILFDFFILRRRKVRSTWINQVMLGLLIAALAVAVMSTPWIYAPGIIFDMRSVLLGISGLFFGTIPTLIAMLAAVIYRILLGGPATLTGVSVILFTAGLGLLWGWRRKGRVADLKIWQLYVFGVLIHLVMLALMFLLPWETALNVVKAIWMPVLLLYPIATVLLGTVMVDRLKEYELADTVRLNEERLRLVVEASGIGLFDQNLLNGNEYHSVEWEKQIGYSGSELPLHIDTWMSLVHPDDLAAALEVERACLEGKSPVYSTEFRMRHKDGSYRNILSRGMVYKNEEGQAVRFIGCHIDITDQKQLEARLAASEARFHSLAESSQDYIMLYDREYRHVYMNPAGLRISGFVESDIFGKTHREAGASPELSELWEYDIEAVFKTGQSSQRLFEWESVQGPLFLDWRLSPVHNPDGEIEFVVGISRDITDLKKAETALSESEKRYRVIVEALKQGVLIHVEGRVAFANQAALELTGYADMQEMSGLGPAELVHPDDLPVVSKAVEDALTGKNERPRVVEERLRRKDGSYIYVEAGAEVIEYQGQPALLVALYDLSERKAAEEKIRRSEEDYRMLFEQAADGIFLSDEQGNYVDVNRSGCELVGFTREELLQMNIRDLLVPEEHAGLQQRLQQMNAGMTLRNERRLRNKNGGSVLVDVTGQSLSDGRIQGMVRDITARKEAEEHLKAAQREMERLLAEAEKSRQALLSLVEDQQRTHAALKDSELFRRSTIDALSAHLCVLDENGTIIGTNRAWDAFAEFNSPNPSRILRGHQNYLGVCDNAVGQHAEDAPRMAAGIRAVLAGTASEFSLEYACHSAREQRWFLARVTRFQAGGLPRAVVAHEDITARKLAEEQLAQMNAALEERVRQRTAQLEAANKELEAFAYTVSHDLRAPLRAISGFSSLLHEDHGDRLNEDGKMMLSRIDAGVKRMGRLIDDLLRLSRISRAEIDRKNLDLSQMAGRIAERLNAGEPERVVDWNIQPGLKAYADEGLMEIVLENLLNNAWKFTASRDRARIEFSARGKGSQRVFSVTDNGVGFEMQYADKLFGVFQRLHNANEYPGTGIGLATIKRIVVRHGGRVWAEGEVGQGAAFHFTLPGEAQ